MGPRTGNEQASLDVGAWYARHRDQSVLKYLTDEQCLRLLRQARPVACPAGEMVKSEGTDQVFLVAEGELTLFTRGARRIKQGAVGAGRIVELGAILRRRPRWELQWVAEQAATLLCFERARFDEILRETPQIEGYLRSVVCYPELRTVKNDLRLFGMDLRDIQATLAAFKLQDAQVFAGTGPKGRALGVVHEGELEVGSDLREAGVEPLRLGEGEYFRLNGSRPLTISPRPGSRLWTLREADWVAAIGAEKVRTAASLIKALETKLAAIEEGAPSRAAEAEAVLDDEEDELAVEDFEVSEKQKRRLKRRKYPVVRQHDAMDCGAACLASVAKFYGRNISLPTFRSLVHVTREGASMLAVKRAAEATGFECIGVSADFDGLAGLRTPFIALMQYHFLVVFRVTDREVVVGDPGRGQVTLSVEEFAKEWSGVALLLRTTPAFFEYPESASSFGKYLLLLRDHKLQLAEVLLASSTVTLLGLLTPLFMQLVFDQVLAGTSPSTLYAAATLVILLHLVSGGLEWVRNYLLTHQTSRLDTKFAALFLRHTFSLPLNFFAVRRVGDITTRLDEIENVRDFFTGRTVNIIIQVLSAVVYCAVIGAYSIKLLALLAIVLPLIVGVMAALLPRILRNLRETSIAVAKNQGMTFEHFNALETIKSINGQVAARWRWEATLLKTFELRRGLERLGAVAGGASELLRGLISVSMLLLSVWLYLRNELSLGQVVAVNSLMGSIVRPLMELVSEWNQLNQVGVSLSRIDDVMTSAVEHEPSSPALSGHRLTGQLELRDVAFQYGSELSPTVLDGVSLTVNRGETIALVGPSGSGKTTLGYLVNRLYAPTGGKVLLDGVNAAEIPAATLRSQVAMVLQDNHLFSGSILDNLTLGDPHPSFERAMEAAIAADAHEFIAKLPQGYSTLLTEGGENLSGGQRQRINIARAIYRDPSILIMDEATSALDAISEQAIVKNMAAAGKGRTTLIIAHRLNTIMHADRVIVLKSGKVVEQGRHQELLEKHGYYYQLCRNQLGV